jgi:hypothetical protein
MGTRTTDGHGWTRISVAKGRWPVWNTTRGLNLSKCWLSALIALGFLYALVWAKAKDPFVRMPFSVQVTSQGAVRGMAFLTKPVSRRPVVLYLHDARDGLEWTGLRLRQLAELGVAAVSVEFNQTNGAVLEAQFRAALDYVGKQPWAETNAVAWFGYGTGVQVMFQFAGVHPERRPQLLICLAGSPGRDFAGKDAGTLRGLAGCRVLLVHGREDEVFPVGDCEELADRLHALGVQTDSSILDGQRHDFRSDQDLVWRVVAEYTTTHLGLSGKPSVRLEHSYWYWWMPVLVLALLLFWRWWRRMGAADLSAYVPRLWPAKGLFVLAICVVVVAFGQATLCLVLPRCTVSRPVRVLARALLLLPEWREDFDALAGDAGWSSRRLKELVQHVELANLQRQQFYTELDQLTYREFVLSPRIHPTAVEEWGWRRRLWEACYPRVRNEKIPGAAAGIIVRFLRERVTIRAGASAERGVETCWELGVAGEASFEELYVAALRSVGIGARVGERGKTELWTGFEWTPSPRPLLESGFRFKH